MRLALTLGVLLISRFVVADSPDLSDPTEGGYRLVWADEFNTDGPPSADDWDFEQGFVRNQELQWYQPQNAVCRDGNLVIEVRKERFPNPLHTDPRRRGQGWAVERENVEYTSSSLRTRGRHAWLYGRIEVRAKAPTGPGAWPAIWTLGESSGWPACGEVDIMEYYSGKILANAAWQGSRGVAWDAHAEPLESFGPGWADEFHVWRMDWTRDQIELSVDGQVLNTIDVQASRNQGRRQRDNPFRRSHYLILNLALGGTQGGDPTGAEFPMQYLIDYVRVYQHPGAPAEQ